MTRHLCWVAVLGVAALPDWATACRPGWGWRRPVVMYAEPAYPLPAPVYVSPPVYVPPAAPVYVPAAPRIEPAAAVPTPAPAPPPIPPAAPTRPPVVEAVRPAGGTAAAPAPTPPAPTRKADPVAPPKDPPAAKEPGAMPKLEVPVAPEFRPIPAPTVTRDPDPGPKTPAIPTPAPPPSDALIPPPPVPVPPAFPDPRKTDAMPSLTLPPDTPVKNTTARSSPLAAGPAVTVSVAAGPGVTGPGYRTVGFYNHTAADLSLTIEGQAVKLPAKTYLYARLGPTFTWAGGGRAAARETVPDGAAGLDVVFRE